MLQIRALHTVTEWLLYMELHTDSLGSVRNSGSHGFWGPEQEILAIKHWYSWYSDLILPGLEHDLAQNLLEYCSMLFNKILSVFWQFFIKILLCRISFVSGVLARHHGTVNGPQRTESHVYWDANGFTLLPSPHHSASGKVWSENGFWSPCYVFTLQVNRNAHSCAGSSADNHGDHCSYATLILCFLSSLCVLL